MGQIKINHDEIKDTFLQISEITKKMESLIFNLQDSINSINEAWKCENAEYLSEISMQNMRELQEEENKIKNTIGTIMSKAENYIEIDKQIINDFK